MLKVILNFFPFLENSQILENLANLITSTFKIHSNPSHFSPPAVPVLSRPPSHLSPRFPQGFSYWPFCLFFTTIYSQQMSLKNVSYILSLLCSKPSNGLSFLLKVKGPSQSAQSHFPLGLPLLLSAPCYSLSPGLGAFHCHYLWLEHFLQTSTRFAPLTAFRCHLLSKATHIK